MGPRTSRPQFPVRDRRRCGRAQRRSCRGRHARASRPRVRARRVAAASSSSKVHGVRHYVVPTRTATRNTRCAQVPAHSRGPLGKTTRTACRRTHRRRTRTGARSTTPTAISRLCSAVRRKSCCQSDVTDWRRGNQPGTRRHGAPQTREPRCNRTQALGLSRRHGPVTLTQASSGNRACTDNWAREHGVTLHAAPRTHAPQRIRNQALVRTVVKFVVHL